MARLSGRLGLLACTLCSRSSRASALYLPISDPRVAVAGRHSVNSDGSFGFDWPGVSFFFTVESTTTVRAIVNATQVTRLATSVSYPALTSGATDFPVSSVWVGPGLSAGDNSYVISAALPPSLTHTVRLTHDLSAGQTKTYETGVPFDVYGFELDDTANVLPLSAAGLPLSRRLEFIGDSITVGAGAEGAPPGSCPYSSYLEHNAGTWNRLLCANFTANCSVVAWSGKGCYANANGMGERMPEYYLQTVGAENYSRSWDFTRFLPDAVVVHLGTNDFSSPLRHLPGFVANFTAFFAEFVVNITQLHYKRPSLPVFIAQGPMNNSPELTAALQEVIATVNSAGGAVSFLDMRNLTQDGCGNHPGPVGHAQMAAAARPQIASVLGW